MDMKPIALRKLLKSDRRFAAEYNSRLSNHLPMALIALFRLGASESQITTFGEMYLRRLAPVPEATSEDDITCESWREHLGKHSHNAEYRRFFASEFERLGRDELLQRYVPVLIEGVGGGAFHPLIRLAYGIDLDDAGEIAEALASWCMAFLPLGAPNEQVAPDIGLQSLTHLTRIPIEGSVIFERLQAVACREDFGGFGGLPETAVIGDLREPIISIYEGSDGDFVALHLMTSLHALRVVGGAVPLTSGALAHYWRAVGAAYVVIGAPSPRALAPEAGEDVPPWEAIIGVALTSRDDHVVKFVHTCSSEELAYGDERYRRLAARKVKLVRA